jgi:hypothetical protein
MLTGNIYIPHNDIGVCEGVYTVAGLVDLLRVWANNPKAVYFIADMLEA